MYMHYVDKSCDNKTRQNMDAIPNSDLDCLEELTKLKDLHDKGIIPDDLYEQKKNLFLEKLQGGAKNTERANFSASGMISIVRSSQFGGSGVKLKVSLDGKKICELGRAEEYAIKTTLGVHNLTISFRRKEANTVVRLTENHIEEYVKVKLDNWDCTPILYYTSSFLELWG